MPGSLTCPPASDSLRRALGLGLGATGKSRRRLFQQISPRLKKFTSSDPKGGSIHENNYKMCVRRAAVVRRAGSGGCAGDGEYNSAAESTGGRSRIYEAG
jgi:hypothetical protein